MAAKLGELLSQLPVRHTPLVGVGRVATVVSEVLAPGDRQVLIQAAHTHDIGYAPDLRKTGLHQLDGAAWLRGLGHERVAALVAHHSESRFEIGLRGMVHLLAKYPREEGAVADALTYCDMTTGPAGEPMTVDERLAEVEQRYGEGTVVVEALRQARPPSRRRWSAPR